MICKAETIQAQGWQDRTRKEGWEYLRNTMGGKKQSNTPSQRNQPRQQSQPQQSQKQQESQPQRNFTDEQIRTVCNFTGPLIQFTGKPLEECYAGKLDGDWTYPAHTKTESAQNVWNDQRMARHEGDETLSNARLAREIIASRKWIEGQDQMGGPVREFMYTLPSRLDEELYSRANVINAYVEAMNELIGSTPDDVGWVIDFRMGQIRACLKSPYYQRAIATSMEALEPYLNESSREFFNKRGGLKNAHTAPRLTWPAKSGK